MQEIMNNGFVRKLEFYFPKHDKSSEIRWILIGSSKKGAVQFSMYTGWFEEEKWNKMVQNLEPEVYMKFIRPYPMGLFYHSDKRRDEGNSKFDTSLHIDAEYTYFDEYGDEGEILLNILFKDGEEALWIKLEEYYKEIFGDENE